MSTKCPPKWVSSIRPVSLLWSLAILVFPEDSIFSELYSIHRLLRGGTGLKMSLSSAAVTRLGCNICCRRISLTKSRALFIMLWGRVY